MDLRRRPALCRPILQSRMPPLPLFSPPYDAHSWPGCLQERCAEAHLDPPGLPPQTPQAWPTQIGSAQQSLSSSTRRNRPLPRQRQPLAGSLQPSCPGRRLKSALGSALAALQAVVVLSAPPGLPAGPGLRKVQAPDSAGAEAPHPATKDLHNHQGSPEGSSRD